MDYCYTCHRILNGALVCPGCGGYAPNIALENPAPLPPERHEPFGGRGYDGSYDPGFAPSGLDADGGDGFGDEPEESVLGPAAIAPTLHRGRAARRRQMVRWKKSRRRAAAATAVALFGGGVTALSMSHSGRSTATTASAQDDGVNASLTTDSDSVDGSSQDQVQAGAHNQVTHDGHATRQASSGSSATPHVRSTYPSTDGVTSIPLTSTGAGTATHVVTTVHQVTGTATGTATTPTSTTTAPPSTSSGSGSGTTASTPPASTPPASTPPATTDPTTPAPVHLCLLVLCID